MTGQGGIRRSSDALEVAAAVIERPDGAVLLGQRPPGKVYAGYWEFPGGKVEAGEPAPQALARELHEELGIDVESAFPWVTRVFTYPHATVRLRFYRVVRWRGEPHPREHQAIAWQHLGADMLAPMLPANAPVFRFLALPLEYAVTDAARWGTALMLEKLERRLEQGLKLVQLREPGLGEEERRLFCDHAIGRAHRFGCKVMVKSPHRGADGIHLTAAELMTVQKKPREGLVAASCHSREELERAIELELDFAVLGPVKEKAAREPLGWSGFARIVAGTTVPVYAIGGLGPVDLDDARRAGAHGLAMIRGAWS